MGNVRTFASRLFLFCSILAIVFVTRVLFFSSSAFKLGKMPLSERQNTLTTESERIVKVAVAKHSTWQEIGCYSRYPLLECESKAKMWQTIQELKGRIEEARETLLWSYRMANERDFAEDGILSKRWQTCAVVGSSGSLLHRHYADEIDSRDLVFRINNPPVANYSRFVGKRLANVNVLNADVYPEQSHCPIYDDKQPFLIIHCFQIERYFSFELSHENLKNTECVELNWEKYGKKTYAISSSILKTATQIVLAYRKKFGDIKKRILSSSHTSAGMRTVLIALHLCREVHLYGFGSADSERFDYYKETQTKHHMAKAVHSFDLEHKFLDDLASGQYDHSIVNLSGTGFRKVIKHR
eukprot:m.18226 g.18226  ORF g.18226 m.18226 type:complete len:355 (+) comp27620_c0_seq2:121-1185(+)